MRWKLIVLTLALMLVVGSGAAVGTQESIETAESDTETLETVVAVGNAFLLQVGSGLVVGLGLGLVFGSVLTYKYWGRKI